MDRLLVVGCTVVTIVGLADATISREADLAAVFATVLLLLVLLLARLQLGRPPWSCVGMLPAGFAVRAAPPASRSTSSRAGRWRRTALSSRMEMTGARPRRDRSPRDRR